MLRSYITAALSRVSYKLCCTQAVNFAAPKPDECGKGFYSRMPFLPPTLPVDLGLGPDRDLPGGSGSDRGGGTGSSKQEEEDLHRRPQLNWEKPTEEEGKAVNFAPSKLQVFCTNCKKKTFFFYNPLF